MVLYYESHIFRRYNLEGNWDIIVEVHFYMIQRNRVLHALAIMYPDKGKF